MSESFINFIVLTTLFVFAAGWTGCSDDDTPDSSLTRRQRDSVLSESRLPGAQGVKTTLTVADSASARTKRLNEMSK